MGYRLRTLGGAAAVVLAVISVGVAGCSTDFRRYEVGCGHDDDCSGANRCFSIDPPQGGRFCSITCNVDADCGAGAFCFSLAGDPNDTHVCFETCRDNIDCDSDWICANAQHQDTGAILGTICVPPSLGM